MSKQIKPVVKDKKTSSLGSLVERTKKVIYGGGKPKEIPHTAQDTIPFIKMYPDGICKVTGKYYTKMVEFIDINYDLLEIEDQSYILDVYSKFINYFDPSINIQIFLFGRQVDAKTLTNRFVVPLQGDRFDRIREEFTGILKSQAKKGRNGIIKTKHVIFGTECENYKEAKSKLDNIQIDVINNLNELGAHARVLDGTDRLLLLHDYFNQDSMESFHFSFKDNARTGTSIKDSVAPPAFDFRFPTRFKSGNMYGSTFYVDILAPRFTDALLKRLLDIDENLTVNIHMKTLDPVKAMKMLKHSLSDIQKMKIEEQKKAVRSGYDMDILPPDITTYEKDTLELLDDLNTSNQKMVQVTFLITCFGRTKKQLENLSQRVSGIIQQANCNLRNLQYLQEQALMASAPIGINETGIERSLPTKCVAIMVPFCTQELFMPGEAIYYGLNALSNNMILADRKKLRTPNGVILGTPGSGKSFSAKREILAAFLMTRDDILVCDPEGEYFPLVNALNGQVIRLATDSTNYLNPMDIQISNKQDKETLRLKSDFIITLCDHIAGGTMGLENADRGIIDRCLELVYAKYYENPIPENMPIMEDLYYALLNYEPENIQGNLSEDMKQQLLKEMKSKALRIANSMVIFIHGSQNYFNHRTNVDAHNRILCFDIRDLSSQLKDLGMLIVQDAVWNRVSFNREKKISTRYYCDEFHLLLRERQTANYCIEMWKRFRKWGGIPTALTQNVNDFLKSPDIEGILSNSDFIYLLNQAPQDQEILADKLNLSKKQLAYVTNSERGSGLIIFDSVIIPFVDKYPTDTESYKLLTTKMEEAITKDEVQS